MSFFLRNRRQWIEIATLSLVVAAGMAMRVIGYDDGFPLLTHVDESAVMDPAFDMSRHYTLVPEAFNRPNRISIYLNFFAQNLYSLVRYKCLCPKALPLHTLEFYAIARIIVALFGSAMILVAYLIGEEFTPRWGLLAALATAFFPSFVYHSHLITPDIPITFFSMLMILLALRFLRRPRVRLLVALTVLAAVNTLEKYPGLLSFGLVAYCLYVRESGGTLRGKDLFSRWLSLCLQYGLAYLFLMYVLSPTLFLNFGQFLRCLRGETKPNYLGMTPLGWVGKLQFYGQCFLASGGGAIMAVLTLAGLAFAFARGERRKVAPLCYGFLYWLLMSFVGPYWERWAQPMYTAPLLLSMYGLRQLWETGKSRWLEAKRLGLSLVAGASFAAMLVISVANVASFRATDTRVAALHAMRKRGIMDEECVAEGYTPLFPSGPNGQKLPYEEEFVGNPGKRYVVLSSSMYGRYYANPRRYPERVALYERIKRENVQILEVKASAGASMGKAGFLEAAAFDAIRLGSLARHDEGRLKGPTILVFEKPS